jgi:hypothetical protein
MGFFQSSYRARVPVAVGGRASVFAVGWRAYVACAAGGPASVALTDDAGANGVTSLAAGSEVEILAWRPRGSGGTRYRVRSTGNGVEGWLGAGNLRSAASATAAGSSRPKLPARSAARVGTQKSDVSARRLPKRLA